MRSKDIDPILPRTEITFEDGDVIVDGARTKLINGCITQNGLELLIRLEQNAADLNAAIKKARSEISEALKKQIRVQDGNRRIKPTERATTSVSYKDLVEKLAGFTAKDKPKDWEKLVDPVTKRGTSKSFEIE